MIYNIETDPQQDENGLWYPQAKLFYDPGDGEVVHCIIKGKGDPSLETKEEADACSDSLAQKYLLKIVGDTIK